MRDWLRRVGGWVESHIRDLFIFGGLLALYIGSSGYDYRLGLVLVGTVMLYLGVPRSGRGDNEGG